MYDGSYTCTDPQLETNIKISLVVNGPEALMGDLTGLITFNARGSAGTTPATFSVKGIVAGDSLRVYFDKWETAAPAPSRVVSPTSSFDANTSFGLVGDYDETLDIIAGPLYVVGSCGFHVNRNVAESAKINDVMAAQRAGTTQIPGRGVVATAPGTSGAPPAAPGPLQTTPTRAAASQPPSQTPANPAPRTQPTLPVSPSKPALSPAATRMSELQKRHTADGVRMGKDLAAMRQLRLGTRSPIPDGFVKAETQYNLQDAAIYSAIRGGDDDQVEKDLQDMEGNLAVMETFLSK